MELHLKKRILGAVVTVTALVIVMPIILDGSRTYQLLETAAPERPETPQWSTQDYERQVRRDVEEVASGEAADAVKMPEVKVVDRDDPAPQGVAGDRTALDPNKAPYAWTLQLGAFGNRDNAMRFRDDLRKKGYKAYVQEFSAQGMTRVYVGPELRRADAEVLQTKLKKELKQQDIYLRRYEAES
ncbi:MAG: SPOR domain-containing protein [Thalassolituus sp.]|jgi:DedD protein